MSMDIAELGLSVNTAGIDSGIKKLDKLDATGVKTSQSLSKSGGLIERSMRNAGQVGEKAGGLINRSMREASGGLDKASKSGKGLTSVLGQLKAQLATIGILAIAAQAVTMANSFESSLNNVQSKLLVTTSAMTDLRNQAKQLGAETAFSASQAADGMGYLAQAGLNTQEILGAMPATLNLASAAQLSLAKSADISTNVMGAFKMQVSDLPAITDVLALTSAKANTSVSEMAEAIKQAGPVANGFGVGIHEVSAAIGELANNGFKGEKAGMVLKNALANLAAPVGAAKKAMASLGITQDHLFGQAEDGSKKFKGFANMLDVLEASGASTTDMIKMFGREAGPGLISLVGSGQSVRELEVAISKSGAAADMAAIQMQGLPGVLKTAASTWEALNLAFMDAGGTDAVIFAVETLTSLMRFLATDGIGFVTENAEILQITLTALALVMSRNSIAALTTFIATNGRAVLSIIAVNAAAVRQAPALIASAAAMNTAKIATRGLGMAMALMGGPVGLIALAAIALFTYRGEIAELITGSKDAKEAEKKHGDELERIRGLAYKAAGGSSELTRDLKKEAHAALIAAKANIELAKGRIEATKAAAEEAKTQLEDTQNFSMGFGSPGQELAGAFVDVDNTTNAYKEELDNLALMESRYAEIQASIDNIGKSEQQLNEIYISSGGVRSQVLKETSGLITEQANKMKEALVFNKQGETVTQKLTDAQKEANKVAEEAKHLTEALQTPQEKFNNSVRQAGVLLAKKAIDQETYSRAIAAAKKQLEASTGVTKGLTEAEKARQAVTDKGLALAKSVRSHQQVYQDDLADLKKLLGSGAISQEVYGLAVKKAKEKLDEATGVTARAAKTQQEKNEILRKAKSLTEAAFTPQQVYNNSIKEYESFLSRGLITQGTFNAAQKEAKDVLDKATGATERAAKAEQERTRIRNEGIALYEKMLNPQEIHNNNVDKARELLEANAINQETYNRAIAQYKKQLHDSNGETERATKLKEAHNKVIEKGLAITQKMRSPEQVHKDTIKEMQVLLEKKAISQTVYNQTLVEAKRVLEDATGVTKRNKDLEEARQRTIDEGLKLTEKLAGPQAAYEKSLAGINKLLDANAIDRKTANAAIAEARKTLEDANGTTEKNKKLEEARNLVKQAGIALTEKFQTPHQTYQIAIDKINDLLAKNAINRKTANAALKDAEVKLKAATGETKRATDAQEANNKAKAEGLAVSNSLLSDSEKLINKVSQLQGLLDKGAISQDTYTEAVYKAKTELDEATKSQIAFSEGLMNSITSADSVKEAMSNIGDFLKDWLKEQILHFAANKIMAYMGVDSGGSGLSGLSNILSGGNKQKATASSGGLSGGTFGQIQAGGLSGSLMAGGMGFGIGQMMGQSGIGTGIGAAIGNMVLPGIGGLVGGALGSVVESLFGGKKKQTGAGFKLNYGEDGVGGHNFQSFEKKRSFWRGTKRWTETSALDSDVKNKVDGYFENLNSTIVSQAESLGMAGAEDILKSFTMATATFTGANAEAQLTAWLTDATNQAYTTAFSKLDSNIQDAIQGSLDTMSGSAEEISARFNYVAQVAAVVTPVLDSMSWSLGETASAATKTSVGLADAIGGLDALSNGLSSYYDAVYTTEEKLAMETAAAETRLNDFNSEMGLTGSAIVDSTETLRAFVEAQDATTLAGQEAIASALLLTDAVVTFSGTAQEAAEALNNLTEVTDKSKDLSETALLAASAITRQREVTEELKTASEKLLSELQTLALGILEISTKLYPGTDELAVANELLETYKASQLLEVERLETLQDLAETNYQEELSRYQSLKDASQDIKEFLDSWDISDPLATPLEKLKEVEKQYGETLALAKTGDTDAVSKVQELANALKESYLDVYASSDTTADAVSNIRNDLAGLSSSLDTNAGQEPNPATIVGSTELTRLNGLISSQEALITTITTENEAASVASERALLAAALAGKIGELGLSLDTSVFQLLEENGLSFEALAKDFGMDIGKLDTTFVSQLNALSTVLKTSSIDVINELGIDIRDLASSLGLDLNTVDTTLLNGISDLAVSLGTDIVTLSQELGLDVGKVGDLISDKLLALPGIPQEIKNGLAPYLTAIEAANDPESLEKELQNLSLYINTLPDGIKNSLSGYLSAITGTGDDSVDALKQLAANMGIDIAQLEAATVNKLGVLATTLGSDLATVASLLGTDLNKVGDIIASEVNGLSGIPSDINNVLQPHLKAIADANDTASLNTALAGLQFYISSLPTEMKDQLSGYLTDIIGSTMDTNAYLETMAAQFGVDISRLNVDMLSKLGDMASGLHTDSITLAEALGADITNLGSLMATSLSGVDGLSDEVLAGLAPFLDAIENSENSDQLQALLASLQTHISTLPVEIQTSLSGHLSSIVGNTGGLSTGLDNLASSFGVTIGNLDHSMLTGLNSLAASLNTDTMNLSGLLGIKVDELGSLIADRILSLDGIPQNIKNLLAPHFEALRAASDTDELSGLLNVVGHYLANLPNGVGKELTPHLKAILDSTHSTTMATLLAAGATVETPTQAPPVAPEPAVVAEALKQWSFIGSRNGGSGTEYFFDSEYARDVGAYEFHASGLRDAGLTEQTIKAAIGHLHPDYPSFSIGSDGIDRDQLANIHQGEAIFSRSQTGRLRDDVSMAFSLIPQMAKLIKEENGKKVTNSAPEANSPVEDVLTTQLQYLRDEVVALREDNRKIAAANHNQQNAIIDKGSKTVEVLEKARRNNNRNAKLNVIQQAAS